MKLYLLSRNPDDVWYDQFTDKLIRAESERRAREIASLDIGDEGDIWRDKTLVTAKIITGDGQEEVILTSYLNGQKGGLNMETTIIIFALSVINIPFIVLNPKRWWNWMAAVFCFGLGIASAIQGIN